MRITGKRKKQSCPKERNEIDCGLYTWWFAKQYLSDCHSSVMYEGGVFGNEMAGDLLELETSFMQLVTNWHALICHLRAINRNLHSIVVQHLRNNPLTSDGIHQGEFISYQAWESYLHEMSRDSVWGDWITLWGLVNMLNIDTAVVPTLGEGGLRAIHPADTSNTDHNLNRTTFLGHEAEAHYHTSSLRLRLRKARSLSSVRRTSAFKEKSPRKSARGLSGIYENESGMTQSCRRMLYLWRVLERGRMILILKKKKFHRGAFNLFHPAVLDDLVTFQYIWHFWKKEILA